MKIGEIIEKHYNKMKSKCFAADVVVSEGRTGEDILQDVCLQALRHFGDKDITREEGEHYLDYTLGSEDYFAPKRKTTGKCSREQYIGTLDDLIPYEGAEGE